MSGPRRPDPYAVLEIATGASDAELRAAYRRAVQRHHPDHNGGSPESERRFEEVQDAYAQIRAQRASGGAGRASTTDPPLDARLAAMEAELSAARDAQERVRRAARDAVRGARDAARGSSRRPSDEELGYVTSDDSISSIFDDTVAGLSEHLSAARRQREAGNLGGAVTDKMADVFEDIGARLRGERRGPPDG
ncbi:MAG: DnaJ domain-containing protein [Actinomycetota bacterium]|nr:DnaJ domain-containing protein [Actinomycetota bacterium]